MVKSSKGLKESNVKNMFLFLLLCILVYLIVYFYLVYPLYNLSRIHSKDEIKEITDLLVLGAKDPSKLQELTNIKVNEISFYYNYFIFRTETHTIWCLMNKHTKFGDTGKIVLYYYDHVKKYTGNDIIEFDYNQLKTYEEKGGLVIVYSNHFRQEINFKDNRMKIYISTHKNTLDLEMYIEEYNTTQPSFLNRYKIANNFVSTSFIETKSPNEWASDNPLIGKILSGTFNQHQINRGNFWFDNMFGCNNFYLSEYYWFVTMNDDWLIYILFYGNYEDFNTLDIPKCLFIKNKKDNQILHCSPGVLPNGFKTVDRILQPIKTTYKSNPSKRFGDESFDEYSLSFESNDISIHIRSIPGASVKVLSYDYYDSPKYNAQVPSQNTPEFDKKYVDVLNNLSYVEYVNKVEFEIKYNNTIQKFQEYQILDAVIVKDPSKPSTIKYNP
jgi:hypothetical protein